MSKDQPHGKSSPVTCPTTRAANTEDSDNMNLFASVWVKIEVDDDEDTDAKNHNSGNGVESPPSVENNTKSNKKRTNRPKNLKCDQCDYTTSQNNTLAIHILGHSDSKPLTCTHCDYKTRYPVSLKRHIFVQHECKDSETAKKDLPIFKCTVCPYTTHFKWNLSSHQRKHDISKQYKCPHCSYSTAYKHNHVKHSRTHKKADESTYFCDKCPFTTKYEGHIVRHLAKIHFEISEKASRCDHCSFSTKTRWRLNIHKNRSQQEKPIRCAHCEYQTLYRCAFKEHKLTHADGNQSNQQWLDSLFATDASAHTPNIKDIETDKGDQAVEIMKMCSIRSKLEIDAGTDLNESTKVYDDLKNKLNQETYYTYNDNPQTEPLNTTQQSEHERNNHYLLDPTCEVEWGNIQVIESPDEDRPFQCITCNYKAKFKASVQRHYQRHHTSHNRPYKCIKCDFSTKTKDQIALHNKRSKSDEILTCKSCSFSTVFKCQFAMHEKAHYPYKCLNCEYTCKKKHDIQKHFTIVHLGNGLKCSHCDFKATRKESLLCHEAIHTGKKPFQCHLCAYASVRRSLLENHLNRFHRKKGEETIIDDSKIELLRKNRSPTDSLNVDFKEKIDNYYYSSIDPVDISEN